MAVPQYKITFDGQLLPGIDKPAAVRNLATLFEASEEAVERLFDGRKLALKRHLLLEDTHKFVPMLEKAGIQTRLEDDTPFDAAGAETLAGGATYDDVAYSPWAAPQSDETANAGRVAPGANIGLLEGRMGRLNFATWSIAITVLAALAAVLLLSGLTLLNPTVAGVIVVTGSLVANLAINVKRLHDINWSGWLVLLSLVPYVGLIIPLILLFMPGTQGANRFGPEPPTTTPNTKWAAGVAIVGIVIFLCGFFWFISMYHQR
jgi:uncharacterized membrane protein YhaH (DUF805 family)